MTKVPKWLKLHKYYLIGGLFSLILIGLFSLTLKAQWVIDNIDISDRVRQRELFDAFAPYPEGKAFTRLTLPDQEFNRFDILVLGIRGIGEEFGGLLTDTILILSLDTKIGKAAITSIPRDLYIPLPYDGKVKVNEVYSIGYDKGGERLALGLAKTVVSQITGVYIDAVVRADFQGFKKLIDAVGGVDIYLDKPFVEIEQWKGIGGFTLPKGWNHLDGQKALFYVRSRFATSDFDRARRQQQLLLALKEKLISLGVLSNPVKIYQVLDIIGDHVKTDSPLSIPESITLAKHIGAGEVKQFVLSTDNYLAHNTAPNGAYILVPRTGDFTQIQNVIQNIFTLELPKTLALPKKNEKPLSNRYPLPNATSTLQAFEESE